jgi:hypothetical protein
MFFTVSVIMTNSDMTKQARIIIPLMVFRKSPLPSCIIFEVVLTSQLVYSLRILIKELPIICLAPFSNYFSQHAYPLFISCAQSAYGSPLAGTFAESCSNNPRRVVLKAWGEVKEAGADLLISLGGSSVIDLT